MSDNNTPIDLQGQLPDASVPRSDSKPIPTRFSCAPTLQFTYSGSQDGVDTNLLVLLHGRGDSEAPFAKLANSLRLPQTATLALRGPLIVPLLDEHEREWWNETDLMGMNVQKQDPSPAIRLLADVLAELQQAPFGWSAKCIHLFGFGQGGTLACETALAIGRNQQAGQNLGSVVSVQGPLLSLPTSSTRTISTRVLYVYRANESAVSAKTKADIAALQRGFASVQTISLPQNSSKAAAMPSNKAEWAGIMGFWSENLRSSMAWQRQGEVYEVTGGRDSVALPKEASGVLSSSSEAVSTASSNSASAKSPSKAPAGFRRGFLSGGL